MFDMSWGEVMVIGAVALIVIGPKDLPKALRTVGNMTGKVRRMASEFQSQFNEAMREAELDEIRKQFEGVNHSVSSLNTPFNPIQTVRDELKGAIEGGPTKPLEDKSGIDAPLAAPGSEVFSDIPVATEPPEAVPPAAPLPQDAPLEPEAPPEREAEPEILVSDGAHTPTLKGMPG